MRTQQSAPPAAVGTPPESSDAGLTWTDHTFRCQCCQKLARASKESIDQQREHTDCEGLSDAEVVSGFDFCLTCCDGSVNPGEYVTDESAAAHADARLTPNTTGTLSPDSRGGPPEHQQPQSSKSPRAKSPYHTIISLSLARQGLGPVDPRHVEAYMRVAHSTLDHLDAQTFDIEVAISAAAVNADPAAAEALAETYGL